MSYKDKRKSILSNPDIDDGERLCDYVWSKMRELARLYNEIATLGIPDYFEQPNPDLFINDALKRSLYDLKKPRKMNRRDSKGNIIKDIDKGDSDFDFFPSTWHFKIKDGNLYEDIPKTKGELYDYFFDYQRLAKEQIIGIETYREIRGILVNEVEKAEENNPVNLSSYSERPVIKEASAPMVATPEPTILNPSIPMIADTVTPKELPEEEQPEGLSEEQSEELSKLSLKLKGKIPPKATIETFICNDSYNPEMAKEYKTRYGYATDYITPLFPYYAKALIQSIKNKFPYLNNVNPYRERLEEENHEKVRMGNRGRHDYLNTEDGVFLLLNKFIEGDVKLASYEEFSVPKFKEKDFINFSYKTTLLTKFIREGYHLPILKEMVFESSKDFLHFDDVFAVDGTGFSTSKRGNYNTKKHPNNNTALSFFTATALVTTNVDVVLFTQISEAHTVSEITQFKSILEEMEDRGIKPKYICADALYCGAELHNYMGELGIPFYTQFREDIKCPAPEDDTQWAKDYRFWKDHQDEFGRLYHKRSNVESVFGAIKEKFSGKLTSLKENGAHAEIFGKVIAHNITIAIQQLFINGYIPHYMTETQVYSALHDIETNENKRKQDNKETSARLKEERGK